MMTLMAGALEALAGPLFRWITVPLIALSALTMAKLAWDKRDARLIREGETICESRWEERVRDEERAVARRQMDAQQSILATERQVAEGLRDDLVVLANELDALAARAASDPKCLSDGVLDALRRRQGGGKAKAGRDK